MTMVGPPSPISQRGVPRPCPFGRRAVRVALVCLGAIYGCSSLSSSVAETDPPAAGTAPAPAAGFLPAACEQRSGDDYRTLVASRIEGLGPRHVLTVSCEGTHSLYLARAQAFDLAPLLGQPVCARYRYIDQPRSPMPCLRPPCPDSERVLELIEVRPAPSPHAACARR